jgi:hypothetical protein
MKAMLLRGRAIGEGTSVGFRTGLAEKSRLWSMLSQSTALEIQAATYQLVSSHRKWSDITSE